MTRPRLQLVSNQPVPAWVPSAPPERASRGRVMLLFCGVLVGAWCASLAVIWAAYAALWGAS